MNPEDLAVTRAERDASPERFLGDARHGEARREEVEETEQAEAVEQPTGGMSSGSSVSSVQMQEIGMARMATQRDDAGVLERHQTAMSRIETGKSQHEQTVGASIKSRTVSRQSKPLPNFGAGKPYPPDLPAREEYVVEFDGPDDPIHAQNWPFKKK